LETEAVLVYDYADADVNELREKAKAAADNSSIS
jgi:hypothetical protein